MHINEIRIFARKLKIYEKSSYILRVSTSDQNYDRQEIELTQLANALGYEVKYTYEEKKSAVLKMDTRDQLTNMRKLTNKEVDRILFGILLDYQEEL